MDHDMRFVPTVLGAGGSSRESPKDHPCQDHRNSSSKTSKRPRMAGRFSQTPIFDTTYAWAFRTLIDDVFRYEYWSNFDQEPHTHTPISIYTQIRWCWYNFLTNLYTHIYTCINANLYLHAHCWSISQSTETSCSETIPGTGTCQGYQWVDGPVRARDGDKAWWQFIVCKIHISIYIYISIYTYLYTVINIL